MRKTTKFEVVSPSTFVGHINLVSWMALAYLGGGREHHHHLRQQTSRAFVFHLCVCVCSLLFTRDFDAPRL